MGFIEYYSKTISYIGAWIATLSSLFGAATLNSLYLVLGLLGLVIGVLGYVELLRTEFVKRKFLLERTRAAIKESGTLDRK